MSVRPQASYPFMPNMSHALFTGGNFNQFNHHHEHLHAQTTAKGGFDRLLEAVAPAALHNSGERFDPPKCHPNTRTAVIQKIMNWVLRSDPETRDAMIMWLSGAAGAGKSAIAQTLAELCCSQGRLLASFFFSRSDPTRNHADSLVATIAYQLQTILPSIWPQLIAAIEKDPLIFKRSLFTQFQSLVVQPLQPLFQSGFFEQPESPRLIIIDGLDECLDRTVQRNIVDVFSKFKSLQDSGIPLVVLIASRPEHDIKTTFNSPTNRGIRADLILDDTYLPDKDIELFLRDSFQECKDSHPFKEYIPSDWPSDGVVEHLVHKSSGQFIYASTVIRYVTSSRHLPHHRLDVVLDIRPSAHDLPFAELDALYKHIFSGVDNVALVLHVISITMLQEIWVTVETVEQILRFEQGAVALLFCDLASVIGLQRDEDGIRLTFMHASLSDFLLDPIRSQNLYIDLSSERIKHASNCIWALSSKNVGTRKVLHSALYFFILNLHDMTVNGQFAEDLNVFSLPDLYSALLHNRIDNRELIFGFIVEFFEMLNDQNRTVSKDLYTKHLQAYDDFLVTSIASYGGNTRIQFQLALIGLSSNRKLLPAGASSYHMATPADNDLLSMDSECLNLLDFSLRLYTPRYDKLLADFLQDRERSKEHTLGPDLFTGAAICCLKYICDHCHTTVSRHTQREDAKRRNQPWLWHRRFPKSKIVGKATPWMWVRKVEKDSSILQSRTLRIKRHDLIYIHEVVLYISLEDLDDPVVNEQLWSEKYWLHLQCVLYFLPRAKKSDELVHLCQHSTFASRSQDFPRKARKVRRAMVEYLERVGAELY